MGRATVVILVGSLRAASINRQLAEAAAHAAPDHVDVVTYDGLGDIPFYNEDLDTDNPPATVSANQGIAARAHTGQKAGGRRARARQEDDRQMGRRRGKFGWSCLRSEPWNGWSTQLRDKQDTQGGGQV